MGELALFTLRSNTKRATQMSEHNKIRVCQKFLCTMVPTLHPAQELETENVNAGVDEKLVRRLSLREKNIARQNTNF